MNIKIGNLREFETYVQKTKAYFSPEQYNSAYFQRFLSKNAAIRAALAEAMEELGLHVAQIDIRLNADDHNELFIIVMDHTTRRIYQQIDRQRGDQYLR